MAEKSGGKRDYYAVLGVARDADEAELKRAFRELARKYHPDINPGPRAEDRFKEANEAYAVLSDARVRARYDRYGFSGVGAAEAAAAGSGGVASALDDLLGDLLRRRKKKQRGRDLRYTLEVTFEEAALGCDKTIQVPAPDQGKPREFAVVVPAGTKEGSVRMIKGEGENGLGGAGAGDLHVIIRVLEHAIFKREGQDVLCEVPVSFTQAALGAVVEVPTLDGKVKMRVPAGTQSGRVFRIRERGIPRTATAAGPRGDQRVRVVVETPTGLSARQRQLLEELAGESGEESLGHPQKQSFLDKLRGLFQD